MLNKFLGQVILFRHGETEYTDKFPDLTPEGIKTIKKTAVLIPFINGSIRTTTIFSSPKTRALGSSEIVKKALCIKTMIQETSALSSIEIKNEKKAKELFAEVSREGTRALAVAYGTDARFEDGIIVEPRSEVKKRFFSFLSNLVKWFVANMSAPLCVVVVSHYEVLYHLVETAFKLNYKKDMPLGYGEIIMINIYEGDTRNEVAIEIIFRKKTTRMSFDYKKREIV